MSCVADKINALPDDLRMYVHDLETRADPAGDVARIAFLQDQVAQLQAKCLEQQERDLSEKIDDIMMEQEQAQGRGM